MNGILLVDKPQGFTSHDVIAKLRGILKERRLGHAGTLDPMATGLLVVFAGRATRAVQFAECQKKEYYAAMRTGITTDTQDITGEIVSFCDYDTEISEEKLCKLFAEFTGTQAQTPPMYSAIKQNGKKLYDLARKGIEVEREDRQINIYELEYLGRREKDVLLRVVCSKGTYIRTLCHDMGLRLGTGAALSELRRTKSGEFSCAEAYTLAQLEAAVNEGSIDKLFLPVDSLFAEYAAVTIDDERKRKCLVGNAFNFDAPNGEYRVYAESGEFLMLGKVDNKVMSTIKSFFEIT